MLPGIRRRARYRQDEGMRTMTAPKLGLVLHAVFGRVPPGSLVAADPAPNDLQRSPATGRGVPWSAPPAISIPTSASPPSGRSPPGPPQTETRHAPGTDRSWLRLPVRVRPIRRIARLVYPRLTSLRSTAGRQCSRDALVHGIMSPEIGEIGLRTPSIARNPEHRGRSGRGATDRLVPCS